MTCADIEPLLPSVVDGEPERRYATAITGHLASCAACRLSVEGQRTARAVLRARGGHLAPLAPPGLRARIAASLRAGQPARRATVPEGDGLSRRLPVYWRGRLSAFAAAAIVILALGAALLPVVTGRSTVLLAAQLALDHLKCFTIDGDGDAAPISQTDAELTLERDYGWAIAVPPSVEAEGLRLVAVRRCLYGDGRAAHLLYRAHGEAVSLFVLPGLARPATELSLFGHDEIVWTEADRTYILVARSGSKAGLARVASYMKNEAK